MMDTVTFALEKLVDDVAAQFGADSARWVAPIYTFDAASTSVPTIDDSSVPTLSRVVRVRFTTGGTIGVDGIVYQTSIDDGATWSDDTELGTATSIAVAESGMTIDFSAGDLTDGDSLYVVTTKITSPAQVFGWREPSKQASSEPTKSAVGPRIVWVPGNDGDIGEIAAARYPGRDPRSLATVNELFTVYLEAYDSSGAENERAQYHAARLLFDAWLRAVYLNAHGTFRIISAEWVKAGQVIVRRRGATIRVVGSIEAMVPDEVHELMPADGVVAVTVSELDVDEEDEFEAA